MRNSSSARRYRSRHPRLSAWILDWQFLAGPGGKANLSKPPSEEHRKKVDDTIQHSLLALVGLALFSFIALGQSDYQLVVGRTQVPFANIEVDFSYFIVVTPFILVGIVLYLHIFLGEKARWCGLESSYGPAGQIPHLFNLPGGFARVVSVTILYVLPVVTVGAFAWKALPLTGDVDLVYLGDHANFTLPDSPWRVPPLLLIALTASLSIGLCVAAIRRVNFSNRPILIPILLVVLFASLFLAVYGPERVASSLSQGQPIRRLDLVRADLRSADLFRRRLSFANLERASMNGAKLWEASLIGAILRGADLSSADLHASQLEQADLTGAVLRAAVLSDADLEDATLTAADASHADMRRAILIGADLRRTDLSDANLEKADLRRAVMGNGEEGPPEDYAILTGTILWGADVRDTNLYGASLFEAKMARIKLDYSDLREADLQMANGVGASLRGSRLQGADLSDSVFRAAAFDRADLSGATAASGEFRKASFNSSILVEVDFSGAELQGASFVKADLRDAEFLKAEVYGADFRQARNLDCDQLRDAIGWKQAKTDLSCDGDD